MVVLGAKTQIDNYLSMRGLVPKVVKGYRVTDEDAMLAAMEAAGTSRMLVEAQLSQVCHGAHRTSQRHSYLQQNVAGYDDCMPSNSGSMTFKWTM